jgi:hypothetical protein
MSDIDLLPHKDCFDWCNGSAVSLIDFLIPCTAYISIEAFSVDETRNMWRMKGYHNYLAGSNDVFVEDQC